MEEGNAQRVRQEKRERSRLRERKKKKKTSPVSFPSLLYLLLLLFFLPTFSSFRTCETAAVLPLRTPRWLLVPGDVFFCGEERESEREEKGEVVGPSTKSNRSGALL